MDDWTSGFLSALVIIFIFVLVVALAGAFNDDEPSVILSAEPVEVIEYKIRVKCIEHGNVRIATRDYPAVVGDTVLYDTH